MENITAYSIDSLSEKISRKSFRIATVGLILFIIRIPALRQGRCSRSGRFSERAIYRHNGTLIFGFSPAARRNGRATVSTPVCFATSPGGAVRQCDPSWMRQQLPPGRRSAVAMANTTTNKRQLELPAKVSFSRTDHMPREWHTPHRRHW